MNKIKVGDKVRFIKHDEDYLEVNYNIGKVYTISGVESSHIENEKDYIYEFQEFDHSLLVGVYGWQIELVVEEKQTELDQFMQFMESHLDKFREGAQARKTLYAMYRLYELYKKEMK